MALLELEHVTKVFKSADHEVVAANDVSLSVEENGFVGLIGESGSGKSTIANMVIGLENPTSGSIRYKGKEITLPEEGTISRGERRKLSRAVRRERSDMQMVSQHPAETFSERMTIGKGIEEGLIYRTSLSAKERQALMHEALEMVQLPIAYTEKYAWEVSGGECQRAAIARSIISRPKLLLCDEPTSALDVTVQAQIIEMLMNLRDELSMGILFISHDLALVSGICEHIYVMKDGRIVEQGEAASLFANPTHPYTVQLLESVLDYQNRR